MNFINNSELIKYLTPTNIILYLLIVNLIGLLIMFVDKKKAIKGKWRIPEKTLMLTALFGGSIGTIMGMYMFRHKTKQLKFTIGFPVILITEIILITYFLIKY